MKKFMPLLLIFFLGCNNQQSKDISTTNINSTDLTKLTIGDGKISNSAAKNYVWSCQQRFGNGPGAFKDGEWIKSDGTYDFTAKPKVDGSTTLPHSFKISIEGDKRIITSNDYPNHPVGTYPISDKDDAYSYDRNPNSIKEQDFRLELNLNPSVAQQASCLPMGAIGFLTTGSVFFNALDAKGEDAVAHEIQDECQGHPEREGEYHYHNVTTCIDDKGNEHSSLVGYALDGFGIYGYKGEGGKLLTNKDLDECHGHTHTIDWDGKKVEMYHYHATREYPYTIGCFKGTPKTVDSK